MKEIDYLGSQPKGWTMATLQLCLVVCIFASGLFLGFSLHDPEIIQQWMPGLDPSRFPVYVFGGLFISALIAAALFLFFTKSLRKELNEARSKATDLTIHDELTGLVNRRYFFDRFDQELDRSRRYGTKLALVMVDIDRFKEVNDELGHPLGDLALSEVARLLQANVRTSDVIARYGGEEFAILVPAQGKGAAIQVAEKLRNVIEVNDLALEGPRLKVTISAGVVESDDLPETHEDPKVVMIRLADRALLQAKAKGRNRVEVHTQRTAKQYKLI